MILAALLLAAPCDELANQAEMNACAHQEFAAADAALNAQWKKTAAVMKTRDEQDYDDGRPSFSAALLESQRAWLKYRDAQCQISAYEMRGGSAESMLISGCQARLTRERTEELKVLEGYQ
jgi:uncharacterized protein YecT (DUF1311 family)